MADIMDDELEKQIARKLEYLNRELEYVNRELDTALGAYMAALDHPEAKAEALARFGTALLRLRDDAIARLRIRGRSM